MLTKIVEGRPFAAVTMVYNEAHYLPLWLQHYGAAVGIENCFIIDHGSDDGSTDQLRGANRIRIPRSPMDDKKRAKFVSEFVSSLLHWYTGAIYTDTDEFLIAEPSRFENLADFLAENKSCCHLAFGLNIYQGPDEHAISFRDPIFAQRQYARFSYAMCKPLVVRAPVTWTPGFHAADLPVTSGDLFLFHLRHYDLANALQRLAITREMPWVEGTAGNHQRWSDEDYKAMQVATLGLKVVSASLLPNDPFVVSRQRLFEDYVAQFPEKAKVFYANIPSMNNELLKLPERFHRAISAVTE